MLGLIAYIFLWGKAEYKPHRVNTALILFVFSMAVSSLLAIDKGTAFGMTYDYFKLLVFYFIVVTVIKDEKDLEKFILAYLFIMFLYIGKSAWEFILYDRHVWRMGIKRMIGIDTAYGDPNAFAASIVYSMPFLWAMIKYNKKNAIKLAILGSYGLLAAVCLVLTGSRSGMVTMLLFLIIILFIMKRKVIGVIALSTTLIAVWFFMPFQYQERFKTTFITGIEQAADASAQGRVYTLIMGIDMFKISPVHGVGPGNFSKGLELFGDYTGLSPHNMYGMLLGEVGLIGTISFGMLLYWIIFTHRSVIKKEKRKQKKNMLYIMTSQASLQVLILLLFNGNFGANLYRYNWLWIGAIGVLITYFQKEPVIAGESLSPSPQESNGKKLLIVERNLVRY
jgi:O-antigen ligase